jgi:type I restriction enzyme S subunit
MRNNLPDSWVAVKLGSIVKELNSGFACGVHNSTGDGIAHLRPMNVTSKGAISLKDLRSVSAATYDKLVKGDVLFNNTNSTELVGKTAYIEDDTDWGYSNHMTRLRFDLDRINSKFVSYYLHNLFYEGYFRANCNNHVSQASISAKFLANEVSIPLPPFAEQNRIVAQLEATMQKLEASQERLENLPALLKKFRQAVLAAAVSGKLTEAWRAEQPQGETAADLLHRISEERRALWEEQQIAKMKGKQLSLDETWKHKHKENNALDTSELPELPDGWKWVSPEQIASPTKYALAIGPFGSNLKVPDYRDEGIPLIFVRDIKSGRFGEINPKFVTAEKADELVAHLVEGGDILITKMGEPPGDACLYPIGSPTAIITADCVKWTLSNEIDSKDFFVFSINSYLVKAQLGLITRGIAQQKISLGRFKTIGVPFPPLAEQQEIVRQVKHYFDLADQLEDRFEQAAALVEQLPQALLAKAFSGQLVAQDPNDEPAGALLAQLQAQSVPSIKGQRGRKSKVMTETPLFK